MQSEGFPVKSTGNSKTINESKGNCDLLLKSICHISLYSKNCFNIIKSHEQNMIANLIFLLLLLIKSRNNL